MRSKAATVSRPQVDTRRPLIIAAAAVVLVAGALFTFASHAQQVYRIVGADGKVTFSDKPPVTANARVSSAEGGGGAPAASTGLPFELRQIASKYPVTLYTGEGCAPCGSARAMLSGRGIPFTEKTVKTNDDIQALARISGESSLPFATIGTQQLKGFSDAEWTQFLTAAGYPTSSVLPASYRAPAVTPLVAVTAPPAATTGGATPAARPPTPVARPAVQPNTNPAGIQF